MRRRLFIKVLAGSLTSPAIAARAQQLAPVVVGFLHAGSPIPYARQVSAFRQGLSETGYDEGRNVLIEYRWGEFHNERLPALATDLVERQVAVIAALTLPSAPAAKAASATIPIVFLIGGDPVALGLVSNMNRPGGNLTGVAVLNVDLIAKRLELLHQLVPAVGTVAVLLNPNSAYTEPEIKHIRAAARSEGVEVFVLTASEQNEIGAAFKMLAQQRISALVVSADPFFTEYRDQLVTLAARYAISTIYQWRDFTEAGGLISYGADRIDIYRQAGIYVGKVLGGNKVGELPVIQPTKFELVLNLNTAKALGVDIPPVLLARADELIE